MTHQPARPQPLTAEELATLRKYSVATLDSHTDLPALVPRLIAMLDAAQPPAAQAPEAPADTDVVKLAREIVGRDPAFVSINGYTIVSGRVGLILAREVIRLLEAPAPVTTEPVAQGWRDNLIDWIQNDFGCALQAAISGEDAEHYANDLLRKVPGIPTGWLPIASAPKGYPALERPSEWFLARPAKCSIGPKGSTPAAVIRRVFGHGFGPWECTGDAFYKVDFFDAWMPLPDHDEEAEPPGGEAATRAVHAEFDELLKDRKASFPREPTPAGEPDALVRDAAELIRLTDQNVERYHVGSGWVPSLQYRMAQWIVEHDAKLRTPVSKP